MPTLHDDFLFRFGFFAGILGLMALWEVLTPRRALTASKPLRWASNLGVSLLNSLTLYLLLPTGAVAAALYFETRGWGLFPVLGLPAWLAVLLSVLILDLVIYLQHVLFHAVPWLWRLHRVHHADLDCDTTTGVRFHTIEMVLSLGIKLAALAAFGCPALAVLIFEVLLNATSLFNHGNVRLPGRLDGVLRLFVVSPDMHRVHHSVLPLETNSNFGFNLPWWDFLFGTYRACPLEGHEGMTIGLAELRAEPWAARVERLPWMLALPFLPGSQREQDNEQRTPGNAEERQRNPHAA